jgi:hypothetical protein
VLAQYLPPPQTYDQAGMPISQDEESLQDHFEEFYEDIFEELTEIGGELEQLRVCENLSDHLAGNVYAKFREEEDAEKALHKLVVRAASPISHPCAPLSPAIPTRGCAFPRSQPPSPTHPGHKPPHVFPPAFARQNQTLLLRSAPPPGRLLWPIRCTPPHQQRRHCRERPSAAAARTPHAAHAV